MVRKLRGWKVAIVAGILTGGEALVNLGIDLPGSQYIPVKWRAALIFSLTVAAFYYRWRATKEAGRE